MYFNTKYDFFILYLYSIEVQVPVSRVFIVHKSSTGTDLLQRLFHLITTRYWTIPARQPIIPNCSAALYRALPAVTPDLPPRRL